jgi:SAM-dependent methyltransferase
VRFHDAQQTRASFEYQWSKLSQNEWSLANPEFREQVPGFICALTELERQWFVGKDVLDAGCGAGRHAFGFCKLGAQVIAVDYSTAVLQQTRSNCATFPNFRGAVAVDLLRPLPFLGLFDLVWSYGVLHHTGDTYTAFRNIADRVRPGGYLLVMLYGEPRPAHIEDYQRLVSLEAWRHCCREMSFDEKVEALKRIVREQNLIEYFDAVSPWINDRCGYDELRTWFAEQGFVDVRRRVDEMDHYLIARRTAKSEDRDGRTD